MNYNLVEVTESGCLNWLGNVSVDGYAEYANRKIYRFLYELFVASIPSGMHLDHVCENKRCINVQDPKHFEVVTPKENMRRRSAKVTHCPRGHEYTETNTARFTGNRLGKTCRECARIKAHDRWVRNHPDYQGWGGNRTHCIHGHPFSGENLILVQVPGRNRAKRSCLTCRRESGKRYQQSHKAKLAAKQRRYNAKLCAT